MPEVANYVRQHAAHITPHVVEKLLHQLPMLKAEFTQIRAPKYPHLVDQLEFLADVVEDVAEGAYKDLPYVAFAGAVFALIYTHQVVDIIPDFDPKFGYADDSVVARAVLIEHEAALKRYAAAQGFNWKKITNKP
ncbi:MAG: hypothetical protein ACOY3I_06865 [Verrucomicrobiota bacterium]